jgi:hypothetical protein
MYEIDELPEYFVTDDRPPRRIADPAWEALAQCQILMQGENGVVGPTLIEPGEVFVSNAVPNHQWLPLNRAAGERFASWTASLPANSEGLTQSEITEAAYMMRPREGEPEIPHDQWWPRVLKLAVTLKERKIGGMKVPQPAQAIRAGVARPVMPFMTAGANVPPDPGRAPVGAEAQRQVAGDAARRTRASKSAQPPLANASASESQVQTAG